MGKKNIEVDFSTIQTIVLHTYQQQQQQQITLTAKYNTAFAAKAMRIVERKMHLKCLFIGLQVTTPMQDSFISRKL